MAMTSPQIPSSRSSSGAPLVPGWRGWFTTADGKNHAVTFALVSSLFLLWGICGGMIDVFDKHFQSSLHVSKAQSAFVQGSWYTGYCLMALPSGWVARRYGYRGTILSGLTIVIFGSLLFIPVTRIQASDFVVFGAFLMALFVVASGLSFLETAANPYTTVLGPTEVAVTRINLAQSCNGIGWFIGPILGGYFVLSKTGVANTSNESLYIPYLFIAGMVAVMLIAFYCAEVPDVRAAQETEAVTSPRQHERPLMSENHFALGVAAQFLYVGAQTGVFSFLVNYVKDDRYMPALPPWLADLVPASMKFLQGTEWHITDYAGSILLMVGFSFFLLGRVTGSFILRYVSPHHMLGVYSLINTVLMVVVFLGLGWGSLIALFFSFFFMSIMFPTIFALGIRGLGEKTKFGSSCMVMSIVGGAILPIVMGWISDHYNMGIGFLLPMVCFAFIMIYGFFWQNFFVQDMKPVE
jgi:FHS family L-fucose permease-like MFS transporter